MMESTEFPHCQNGEGKLIPFMPEFKITYLKKVKDPGITKSPSWPSSPAAVRSDTIREDGKVPAYLTLGRKGFIKKVSDDEFGMMSDAAHTKRSSDPQIEEIRSMLSSLDLSKYLRKPKEPLNDFPGKSHDIYRRSISDQPQMNSSTHSISKKSFLDDIPPPPKTKSMLHSLPDINIDQQRSQRTYSLELTPLKRPSRTVNPKLKELTERLRPSSAPPSPHRRQKPLVPYTAPPTSDFSFWKDPLPDVDVSSAFQSPKEDTENMCDAKEFLKSLKDVGNRKDKLSSMTKALSLKNSEYATLPRAKQVNLNKSKSVEPRTLACLDLNTSLDLTKITDTADKKIEVDIEHDVTNLKKDLKRSSSMEPQRNNKNGKSSRNILQRQEECENNSEIIPSSTRRGSLKNNSSKKREDFDLNFVNFGSLTYPKEKREERRKSLTKSDSLDKSFKMSEKNSTSVQKQREGEISNVSDSEGNDNSSCLKRIPPVSLDVEAARTLNEDSKREVEKDFSLQPQSAPVKSLEEEIRTIAKLLDGKESLFLKLIQSSKIESGNENAELQNIDPQRSTSPTESTETSGIASEIPRNHLSRLSTGRSSPSRLRAMTVPTTDNNRNQAVSNFVSPPQQKRYFKKRLRGPYGEMLEQEMSKSVNKPRPSYAKDLDFLKELESLDSKNDKDADKFPARSRPLLRSSSHSFDETHSIAVDGTPKRKTSANIPIVSGESPQDALRVPTTAVTGTVSEPILHIRSHSDSVKTSSTWNVDTILSAMLKQPSQQGSVNH